MKPSSDDPVCRICGENVDPEEDYCWGCKSFICEGCTGERVFLTDTHNWQDHESVQ